MQFFWHPSPLCHPDEGLSIQECSLFLSSRLPPLCHPGESRDPGVTRKALPLMDDNHSIHSTCLCPHSLSSQGCLDPGFRRDDRGGKGIGSNANAFAGMTGGGEGAGSRVKAFVWMTEEIKTERWKFHATPFKNFSTILRTSLAVVASMSSTRKSRAESKPDT